MFSTLSKARVALFKGLSESVLTMGEHVVGKGSKKRVVLAASNADFGNRASLEISNAVLEMIGGGQKMRPKLVAQTSGDLFEREIAEYVRRTFLALKHLRPGEWDVFQVKSRNEQAVTACEQYAHLNDLAAFCDKYRELAAALGNDYAISPDVIVTRRPETDKRIDMNGPFLAKGLAGRSSLRGQINDKPILHACISCKFTLRSDRSQNARSEALNLIRNRKGRAPHIVIVTAECLPSRLASLALGTGDIDCLYHIALPELIQAVDSLDHPDAKDMLDTMIAGKRIRDVSDLALDLAV